MKSQPNQSQFIESTTEIDPKSLKAWELPKDSNRKSLKSPPESVPNHRNNQNQSQIIEITTKINPKPLKSQRIISPKSLESQPKSKPKH